MKQNKSNIPAEKQEALKFSALEFTYWAAMSVGSFLTVFLQGIGFTASQVGTVNAACSAVGVVSGPIWGMLSDKLQSIKRTMIACILFAVLLQTFIPAAASITIFGIPLIMLYMPLVVFFTNPSMLLLDSWAIQSSHKNQFTYSTVRSMGSISWAVAGVIVSLILSTTGGSVRNTFYISSLMFIPVAAIAFLTRNATGDEDSGKRSLSFKEMQIGSLFKSYYFTAYLIYTFILNFAFIAGYGFYSYLIKDVGGDINQLGLMNGINASLQFLTLLFMRPIQKRFPLHKILIVGNILTGVQYLLFGVATTNLTQMLVFASINGIGSGFMIASGAKYIFSLAPKQLKATAQTVCGAANSVAGIFGNFLGGVLVDRLGIKPFYLIVAIWILSSVLLFAISFVIGQKVLKFKVPDERTTA